MKHFSRIAVSAALSLGMIVGAGGVALASGHGGHGHQNKQGQGTSHKPSQVALTGTVTCNVHGTIAIGTNGYVRIHANFTPKHGAACDTTGSTVAHLRVGHLNISAGSHSTPTTSTTTSTTTTTTTLAGAGGAGGAGASPTSTVATTPTTTQVCTPVPSGSLPALANGTAMWQPRKKVAPSTGISFPSGAISTTTSNMLQFTFTGGTVTGSFATTSATLTLTSRANMTKLGAQCHGEYWVIPVTGTATL